MLHINHALGGDAFVNNSGTVTRQLPIHEVAEAATA
ncbi:hypothetical protein NSPZN2_40066 [Nitrospira defluvii]|uniref:Uncharacterized protein n=1 Tax=Nitrospira defluvii TaxID=330214 RepID=A0ABM8RQT9_9BACT|nr:hypothetical protein NSPZN2_40066 [Nitrospira defluvii]